MVDPVKLAHQLRKYSAVSSAVANKNTSPGSFQTPKPSASSLRPQSPKKALPAMKPVKPSLVTTPGNMTMSRGPMPATAPTAPPAMPTTPRSDTGVRGGVGPAPKTAADDGAFLQDRLKAVTPDDFKPTKPPSLQSSKPPAPPKSFVPKKPSGYSGRAGMTQGTT